LSLDLQLPPAAPAALTLDELLERRSTLRAHEEQLSYWRRVVQGRLDLLRARLDGGDPDALADVLGGAERCGTRTAYAPVRHVEPMLELATADRAWEIASCSDDPAAVRHAVARLAVAERWLSDQRGRVLAELDHATDHLARRLRDDPGAYLRSVERRSGASTG
jgi:hypothetical protein